MAVFLKFLKSNENESDDKGDEWSAYLECVGVVEQLVGGKLFALGEY